LVRHFLNLNERELIQVEFEEEDSKSLQDYLNILRRRKWPMLLIAGLLFLIAAIIAAVLPPVYRSTATILIEEQDIPRELVQSTVTSYAAQRIEVINREVMTRSNLLKLIDQHNLYSEERGNTPVEIIVDEMRQAISLDMISAEVIDPLSGRPTQATIAFTVSFDGRKPDVVQRVTNDLVSLYLSENIRRRTRKASETSDFLAVEAEKLSKHLAGIEARISDFKARNAGALPEFSQMNMQLTERAQQEISGIEQQLRSLKERQYYLEGQLVLVKPNAPIVATDGRMVLDDSERLRMLRSEYARVSAKYGSTHPDVTRLKREIAALEQEAGAGGSGMDPREEELQRIQSEYTVARNKYSAQHPDVKKLQRRIANLEADLQQSPPQRSSGGWGGSTAPANNPAFIALQSQLKTANSEISSLSVQRNELKSKIAGYESARIQSPEIEREYTGLMREKLSAEHRQQEINQKLMDAQLSQQLEKESKAERFSLIESAMLPERPIKPNRLAIVFLGLVFSVAGGIGYAAVAESMNKGVFGRHQLATIMKEPPLSVIPYIESDHDIQRKRKINIMVAGSIAVTGMLLIAAIHFLWKPLDVIWFVVLRNLGI